MSRDPLKPFDLLLIATSRQILEPCGLEKTQDLPFEVDSVKTLAWSIVKRPEINVSADFLELTIYGRKDQLYNFFREYQEGSENNETLLYLNKNDALTSGSSEWAAVKDYNEIITPLIGVAKPKNFTLKISQLDSIKIQIRLFRKED